MPDPIRKPEPTLVQAEEHLHGDHQMLNHRLDQLEGQMNERMHGMQSWFMAEVKDLRSFIIKALVWLAGPLSVAITSLFGWEWYQVTQTHSARLETTKMVSAVVQRQEDMVRRLEDLKEFNQNQVANSDDKNKAFIDALNQIVNQHINGRGHRGD